MSKCFPFSSLTITCPRACHMDENYADTRGCRRQYSATSSYSSWVGRQSVGPHTVLSSETVQVEKQFITLSPLASVLRLIITVNAINWELWVHCTVLYKIVMQKYHDCCYVWEEWRL